MAGEREGEAAKSKGAARPDETIRRACVLCTTAWRAQRSPLSARGQHVRALADITGHRDRIGRGTAEPPSWPATSTFGTLRLHRTARAVCCPFCP